MKKLLILLLFPLTVFAQNEPFTLNKPVMCDKIEVVIKWLENKERNQKPFWIGHSTSNEIFYGVIVNERTGSWTMIEFNDKYACVLGTGEKNRLTLPYN
jgi:hypothetical protein